MGRVDVMPQIAKGGRNRMVGIMRKLSLCLVFVVYSVVLKAEDLAKIPRGALVNLVYHSAVVQGKWPDVVSAAEHTTDSQIALDDKLELIGIA